MKRYSILLITLCLLSSTAFAADTVADIANNMIPQIKNIPQVIYIVAYLCGAGCGIKAALKFKEANESRGQVKITAAIIYFIAAALFLGLPTLMNTGMEFMGFDSGGSSGEQFKY